MEISPELSTWLADQNRQLQSRAAADAARARWSAHPLFVELRAELDAMPRRAAEGVLAAADRFMDRLGDIDALLCDLIAGASADPFFSPALTPTRTEINTGYMLYADEGLTIGLGVVSADDLAAKRVSASGQTAISFTGLVTSYRFLKAGGATLSFWEASETSSHFSQDVAGSCRFVERRQIGDGARLLMDGRRQSLVIEHLRSDMLCLQAIIHVGAAPISVDYDSLSLRYIGAVSTDEASSRTQTMVTLLRLMNRADAMPLIEQELRSPHFYTRWYVMREMLALDAERALPHLRRMADGDPHPEVRFAATQTLSLFFEDEQEEALQCRA
jgi:hypothetical protein